MWEEIDDISYNKNNPYVLNYFYFYEHFNIIDKMLKARFSERFSQSEKLLEEILWIKSLQETHREMVKIVPFDDFKIWGIGDMPLCIFKNFKKFDNVITWLKRTKYY